MTRLLVIILAAAAVWPGCQRKARQDGPAASAPTTAPGPRIVSFSPAITEILFDMGLGDSVVGVTSQDILPPDQRRPAVGDRFRINTEAILAVEPDLILMQQDPADFDTVARLRPQVRIEPLKLETLADVIESVRRIGAAADRQDLGSDAAAALTDRLEAIRRRAEHLPRPRVLFTIGYDRPFVAGPGTFLADLIDLAGGVNAGADVPGQRRWRDATAEGIIKAAPDVLICQVDPGREKAARDYWLALPNLPAARTGRVHAVTDRHWTIPSTRLGRIAQELAEMIHPPSPTEAQP